MSTRAIIARVVGDGFAGRYHHFDGYPTGLGKRLYEVVGQLGVTRALALLVDEHPVGWSTIIGCDITKEPGYQNRRAGQTWEEQWAYEQSHGPQCYCHGDRHEEGDWLLTDQGDDGGAEWAYAISERSQVMTVYKRRYDPERWYGVALVRLDDPEPDWEAIEQKGKAR